METAAVPFITAGNRQLLTDWQLADMPWLVDFIHAFPHCFERDDLKMCYYFYREVV